MIRENKFGHFEKGGTEFVITRPQETPRPWINKLFNNNYYLSIDQFNRSMSQYQDGIGNWSLVCISGGEFFFLGNKGVYVRDSQSGEYWDMGWFYTQRKFDFHQTRVGLGYNQIESRYENIEMSWRIFVPVQDSVELWTLKIKNLGVRRRISLFPFVQFDLTGYTLPEGSGAGRYDSYTRAEILKDVNAVLAVNQVPNVPIDKYSAVMAADSKPSAYETVENNFLGVGNSFSFPLAMQKGRLSNTEAQGNRLLGALQFDVELKKGEEKEINIVVGAVNATQNEHRKFISRYMKKGAVSKEFAKLADGMKRRCDSIQIKTPDEDMDRLINCWVKQQVSWCAHFSRGWGKGYRDTLQDGQAYRLVENDPGLGDKYLFKYKEILMSALTHQYADGRGTRKWAPINRENYNDAPAWLIYAVIDYLKESGDYEFLEKEVPYLDKGYASVFEHVLQAARQMLGDRGRHGMVRMRYGDWNDGITGVGAGGEGESVMTTQMLYGNLILLREMCEKLGLKSSDGFTGKLKTYSDQIYRDMNRHAWDGEYYCRAFDDKGRKVGAANCKLGKIYVEPQSFGLSQGLASASQAAKVLKSVEKYLETDYGLPLLYPSYRNYDPSVGRLTGHVAGVWENGGVYCHGTAFFILGLLRYGYADKAYGLFRKLLASNPKNPSEKSGLEPYVLTNCFVGPENKAQAGFARLSWETGTASWIFRDVLEVFFGITSEYDGLAVNPCLPSAWTEVWQSRWYRGRRFEFVIRKGRGTCSGVRQVKLNGIALHGNFIPLADCGKRNMVEVAM